VIAELDPSNYWRARAVFQGLNFHLAVAAILGGSASGKVFVDDAANPQSGLAWTKGRVHLSGNAGNEDFNRVAGRLFAESIYPRARAAGQAAISVFYDRQDWEPVISTLILKDRHPFTAQREYYSLKKLEHDWQNLLPAGYRVELVGAQLLADRQLGNLERLEAELCSERESVSEFLERSFGTCLVYGDHLVSWCLSEYNHSNRCEIGIETIEAYQRRGFATLTASALVEHARSLGIDRIGWHCAARNTASGAAARAIGFVKERDYPAYVAWLE
jgi:GNAT superfamily N-acetyltransferase